MRMRCGTIPFVILSRAGRLRISDDIVIWDDAMNVWIGENGIVVCIYLSYDVF